MRPDVVGLQEVDRNARRSGEVDQAQYLGEKLGMHAAFGKFMDLDGGQYGMAVLSRHPIEKVRELALPEGNEPRIALACQIQPPDRDPFWVVNVHFDWVGDDEFRFAQASRLAEHLAELDRCVLLGDFNDVSGSRTLKLLSEGAFAASKPQDDRFTFSSTDPEREIDFIYCFPSDGWQVRHCRVLDAPRTSDHRPVLAVLEMVNGE
ncbi:MAG: endonuclease/exonuclease/phosphatase family protein [Pirellulaceae bacterium]